MAAVDDALAAAAGSCFVDVRAELTATNGGIAPAYAAGDGVHLNDAGHRIIFDRIVAALDAGACVRLSTP
jgi:lysophospholipase L1-like esterase